MVEPYEIWIGLEVHVQLKTRTKIFCGCSTVFQPDQPNCQTCPVCLGLPGSLPVLNGEALRLAVHTALALHCDIAGFTKWDRKQYFYPDLPKGYQISQYDLPFSREGWLEFDLPTETGSSIIRRVRIQRAHLEEDAGKNLHDESGRGRDSQVDLNRAGTPLVEIVTYPDLRSPQEARLFLQEMHLLVTSLGISEGNMQEGNLRCDANINLHIPTTEGSIKATPIVEIKNLNSFRFLEQALEYEVRRQWKEFQQTGLTREQLPKTTRGYDADRGVTYPQREKEEAADYRYFPDPDLVPVIITAEQLACWQAELAEPPGERRRRFRETYGLSSYDAAVLVNLGASACHYFEALTRLVGDAKQAVNWVTQDVQREINQRGITFDQFPLKPEALAALIHKVQQRQLTLKAAREVFPLWLRAIEPTMDEISTTNVLEEIIHDQGLVAVAPDDALDAVITQALAEQAKAVQDYRSGKQVALGALIGYVMKRVKGADPQRVRERLIDRLKQS